MSSIVLSRADFQRFESEKASVIANELNVQLQHILSEPDTDAGSLATLKRDMIAAPQLYLSQKTLNQLNLTDFVVS